MKNIILAFRLYVTLFAFIRRTDQVSFALVVALVASVSGSLPVRK